MSQVLSSTDYWYARAVLTDPTPSVPTMLATLKLETPQMCSVVFERACNMRCAHCIFPRGEKMSEQLSRAIGLDSLVVEAARQLPGPAPRLLHEGRILRPWHLDVLVAARQARPDLQVGLIDNGTYVSHLEEFRKRGFRLDWLDLSLDGPEAVHIAQRGKDSAFRDAMSGFQHAREVVKPRAEGGRVSALFTLTTINRGALEATADLLLGGPDGPLVDEFHVTTVSPARPGLELVEQHDLSEFWAQARRVYAKYGQDETGRQCVFFRLYRHQELPKLARIIGNAALHEAFATAEVAPGEVYLKLDGVPVVYSPLSLWPGETFLIDVDGYCRTAYSIALSLADLRRGQDASGADTTPYTVAKLEPGFNLEQTYQQCVDKWWSVLGQRYFEEEIEVFRQLRA
jgi:MoaA/NifB/PqqE/SkfB family radical SAM enzyme